MDKTKELSQPIIDQEITFNRPNGTEYTQGKCRIRIFEFGNYDPAPLIIVSALPDNKGLSITNGIEQIATKIAHEFLFPKNYSYHRAMWIEHYPERQPYNHTRDPIFNESFSLVTLTWNMRAWRLRSPWASAPSWRHINKSWIEELLGASIE